MGYFKVGQICLNGHQVTGDFHPASPFSEKFCVQCGAGTIIGCPSCQIAIRGYYEEPDSIVFAIPRFETPAYCPACGKAYPWTDRAMEAARELISEIEGVSPEDIEKASASLPSLASNVPGTQVAVARWKKLLVKAGPVIGGALEKVIVSVATEAVKKQMGLG